MARKKGKCKTPARTIVSNDQTYTKVKSHNNKRDANKQSKSLRSEGYNAQVKTNACNVSTVYKGSKKRR